MGWQPVPGREAHYEVSTDGCLRKVDGTPVGTWLNDQGYRVARLSKPRAMVRVHRLVAEAFVPNPEGKPFVNHLDNSPQNNRVENLEWCTQAENLEHMTRQGRRAKANLGRRPAHALLTDEQVRELRSERLAGRTFSSLAARFGVSKRTAIRCAHGEYYSNVR